MIIDGVIFGVFGEIDRVDMDELDCIILEEINGTLVCGFEEIIVGEVIIFWIIDEMVEDKGLELVFILELVFYNVLDFVWFGEVGKVEVIVLFFVFKLLNCDGVIIVISGEVL